MSPHALFAPALVLLGLLMIACESRGQAQEVVTAAVWPLPLDLRTGASVVRRTEDGSFMVLRDGVNAFFCIADKPDDDRFSVECHPKTLQAYLARRQHLSLTEDRAVRDSLLTDEIRTGHLALPVGALSRFVSGTINPKTGVPDSVRVWSEIDVPFAGAEETGLTTENAGEDPWLMRAHEYGAHIMIDYRTLSWDEFVER